MEPAPARPRSLLIWLIIAQVLTLGTLVVWLAAAGMSVMAFDSGASAEAWAVVGIVWLYPLLPVGLSIGFWVAYARQKNRLAVILSLLSFLPPLLLCLLFILADFLWFALLQ